MGERSGGSGEGAGGPGGDEARQPLLGVRGQPRLGLGRTTPTTSRPQRQPQQPQQQKQQQHEHVAGSDEETTSPMRAPWLARCLGALSAGRLPSNAQLYALLHRLASRLDAAAEAVPQGGGGRPGGETSSRPRTTSTHPATERFCAEAAETCRDLARWLDGGEQRPREPSGGSPGPAHGQAGEASGEEASSQAEGRGHAGADKTKAEGDDSDVTRAQQGAVGARGNANEQWQRLISSAMRAGMTADWNVENESLETMVEEASEAIKQGAQDMVDAVRSLIKLSTPLLASRELQGAVVDAIRPVRHAMADAAGNVADRAKEVEEKTRPGERRGGKEPEPIAELSVMKDTAKQAMSAVTPKAGAREKLGEYVDEKKPDSWTEEFSMRLARMIDEVRSDPSHVEAMRKLATLAQKYAALTERAAEAVSELVDVEQPSSGSREAGESAEAAAAKLRGAVLGTSVNARVEADEAMMEAMRAARQVIEGLAGGKSLEGVASAVDKLREDIREDSGWRQWIEDARVLLERSVDSATEVGREKLAKSTAPTAPGNGEGEGATGSSSSKPSDEVKHGQEMGLEKLQSEVQDLLGRLHDIVVERPSLRRDWHRLVVEVEDFYAALGTDATLQRLVTRVRRVARYGAEAARGGARALLGEAGRIANDLMHIVVASVGEVLHSVPLPRVEFSSERLDAAVEEVVVPSVGLIPDFIGVTSTNDLGWKRYPSAEEPAAHVDTQLRLIMRGFRVAVEDVSFYVEEKATAPKPESLGGCCGCYGRYDDPDVSSCWLRGPASWFAYRESALLDLGLRDQGLSIELDLRDAGQEHKGAPAAEDESSIFRPADVEDDTSPDRRKSFFTVDHVRVDASDSFTFRLRNSHHWLLNTLLLEPIARPTVQTVLQRTVAALVQHAFEAADEKLWDLHARSYRVARERAGRRAEGELRWRRDAPVGRALSEVQQDLRRARLEATPEWSDYLRVLTDERAGKSAARLEREQREREERAREEQERQEAQEHEEAVERERRALEHQPRPTRQMKVGVTGVTRTDDYGDYSLSVGYAPRVLPAHKRGPPTQRDRQREELRRSWWAGAVQAESGLARGAKAVKQGAQESAEILVDVREGTAEARRRAAGGAREGRDWRGGWRSELFEL